MVSSAVYRYFPSRDQLLTALIIDAYDAVGFAAEQAAVESRRAGLVSRWMTTADAIRTWALINPHEYALIYGSPVPGYAAPVDTIDPAARVSLALLGLVAEAVNGGEIVSDGRTHSIPRPVRSDLDLLRETAHLDIPHEVLSRVLQAWSQLFGTLSLEMFGHLHNVIHDFDAYFRYQMRRTAEMIVDAR